MGTENVQKFETIGNSDPVTSVCLAIMSMHIYVKYEGSAIHDFIIFGIFAKWGKK